MASHTLPPELERYIADVVASGKFRSADEAISEAVRLLRERERRLDLLRADIDAGLDQIERGEVIELTNEDDQRRFFNGLKEAITPPG
jgi:antitoxin ParD1/3/4